MFFAASDITKDIQIWKIQRREISAKSFPSGRMMLQTKLKSRMKVKHGGQVPRDAQLQTLPSIGTTLNMDEDVLKVFMVDQLW
jgi:hypothetical protein